MSQVTCFSSEPQARLMMPSCCDAAVVVENTFITEETALWVCNSLNG